MPTSAIFAAIKPSLVTAAKKSHVAEECVASRRRARSRLFPEESRAPLNPLFAFERNLRAADFPRNKFPRRSGQMAGDGGSTKAGQRQGYLGPPFHKRGAAAASSPRRLFIVLASTFPSAVYTSIQSSVLYLNSITLGDTAYQLRAPAMHPPRLAASQRTRPPLADIRLVTVISRELL